jgi:hypothetical protein
MRADRQLHLPGIGPADLPQPGPDVPPAERYCRSCGSTDVVIGKGRGPHYAMITCRNCRAVAWAPRPQPRREGWRHG